MQVFLVEDSPPMRERLTTMLGELPGAEVVGYAHSAEAAIESIFATRPDVVLLDIALASGSGFDVLRAVSPQAPEVRIFVLSSFAAYPYRQLAEKLGAQGFFDKAKEFERVRELITEQPQ